MTQTILGVSNGWTAGATLMKDGEIVAAANEERFNRVKLYWGFPHKSIEYVLSAAGLTLKDVDHIAYGWMKGLNLNRELAPLVARAMAAAKDDPLAAKIIRQRVESEQRDDTKNRDDAIKEFKKWGMQDKVKYFDHHKSHAGTAFYTSPFDEALVVTADGRGDYKSVTVSIGSKKDGLKLIDWRTTFDSLGFFYSTITSICGYKPQRHEGKITGLAAYGNPDVYMPTIKKMIDFKDNTIMANVGKWYKPFDGSYPPALANELSKYSKEDIAAAAQKHLEDITVKYVSKFVKEYKLKNICLAGGVFANVRVNQEIMKIDGVENVYIHPSMGDGGIATGGACLLNFDLGGKSRTMEHAYLGPKYSDEEIEAILKEKYPDLKYEYVKGQRAGIVCDLVKNNKVVGFFEGRMEYGPRALGARTILFHSKDKSVNDWLNKRLRRTEFMPFAPVTIAERAKKCYIGWKPDHIASRFMTICYDCTPEMIEDSPATVHIDNTARPQVITREHNPDYYDVVKKFCDDTGALSMINTSFNQHEEPIVCTPTDAIESFKRKNVDVLSIGNFIVRS